MPSLQSNLPNAQLTRSWRRNAYITFATRSVHELRQSKLQRDRNARGGDAYTKLMHAYLFRARKDCCRSAFCLTRSFLHDNFEFHFIYRRKRFTRVLFSLRHPSHTYVRHECCDLFGDRNRRRRRKWCSSSARTVLRRGIVDRRLDLHLGLGMRLFAVSIEQTSSFIFYICL